MPGRKDLYLNLIKELNWTPEVISNIPILTLLSISSEDEVGEEELEIALKNSKALGITYDS